MYVRSQMIGRQFKLRGWEENHLRICPFCYFESKLFQLYFGEIGIDMFLREAEQRGKEPPFSLD
jgi:hypothetical protein